MHFNSPLSMNLAERLIQLFELPSKSLIIDAGCGTGLFLTKTLAHYPNTHGIGLDQDEEAIQKAKEYASKHNTTSRSRWIAQDAKTLRSLEGIDLDTVDLALCIGSTHVFAWDEHAWTATLDTLIPLIKPGGALLLGEPLWHTTPPKEYLEFLGPRPGCYRTHIDHIDDLRTRNLIPLYATTSSLEAWDDFEWSHQLNIERAWQNDPTNTTLQKRVESARTWRDAYIRWGRGVMGFGWYYASKPL